MVDLNAELADAIRALSDKELSEWLHVYTSQRDDLAKTGEPGPAHVHAVLVAMLMAEQRRRKAETKQLERDYTGASDVETSWGGSDDDEDEDGAGEERPS